MRTVGFSSEWFLADFGCLITDEITSASSEAVIRDTCFHMLCQDCFIGWERQNEKCAKSDLLMTTLLLIAQQCGAKLEACCGQRLPGALGTIYPACPLALVAFSSGNLLAPQMSYSGVATCPQLPLLSGPLSFRDIVAGKKLLVPKRINLSNAGSLTILDGCTIFPRWQARDTCATHAAGLEHLSVSRKHGTNCTWLCGSAGLMRKGRGLPALCSYCRNMQGSSEWRRG